MISLGHGSGGRLTWNLIREMNEHFRDVQLTDSAMLRTEKRIAFTTDSFVVHPLFFPGGNIGTIAHRGISRFRVWSSGPARNDVVGCS